MIDKYLLGLRQSEYRQRKKQEWKNNIYRNNRYYMNQEPVPDELLKEWDNQPKITFDLKEKNERH